jgi:hypothetical protein
VQPACETPGTGDRDGDQREDGKRVRVQPRVERRPTTAGAALDVEMDEVEEGRRGERRKPDTERQLRPETRFGALVAAARRPSRRRGRDLRARAARRARRRRRSSRRRGGRGSSSWPSWRAAERAAWRRRVR